MRKKIFLSLANKDGGAHVDEQLEAYYEVLQPGKTRSGSPGPDVQRAPLPQSVTTYPNALRWVANSLMRL